MHAAACTAVHNTVGWTDTSEVRNFKYKKYKMFLLDFLPFKQLNVMDRSLCKRGNELPPLEAGNVQTSLTFCGVSYLGINTVYT